MFMVNDDSSRNFFFVLIAPWAYISTDWSDFLSCDVNNLLVFLSLVANNNNSWLCNLTIFSGLIDETLFHCPIVGHLGLNLGTESSQFLCNGKRKMFIDVLLFTTLD